MNEKINEQENIRLIARYEYIKELASVQAEQLEKSMLEVADIAEKLKAPTDAIKSIREMTSIVAFVKNLKGKC